MAQSTGSVDFFAPVTFVLHDILLVLTIPFLLAGGLQLLAFNCVATQSQLCISFQQVGLDNASNGAGPGSSQ